MGNMSILWEHQKRTLEIFDNRSYFGLFFEQGTGKTRAAIECYKKKCYDNDREYKCLIICPIIVVENWKREFVKFAPEFADLVTILDGSERDRVIKAKDPRYRIFITGISSCIMKNLMQELRTQRYEFLILDESHMVKNPNAKRTKAIISLADGIFYKLVLSGTPILNSPLDIWAQFRILSRSIFGDNWYVFRAKYLVDLNASMPTHVYFPKWVMRKERASELSSIIRNNSFRVLKKDALDLPPLVYQEIFVDLLPEQKKHYREMEEEFLTTIDSDVCSVDLALTKMLRLQQIVCGILQPDDKENVRRIATAKAEALMQLLEVITQNAKVIVWSNFIATYKDISLICDKLNLPYKLICGNQGSKERQDGIDAFNGDNDIRVMIANQSAGGVGINLCAASYMIYYSKTFNLGDDLQSEARCHRGGSEIHDKITRIDIIAKNTIDEEISLALRKKLSMSELILNIKKRKQ